MERLLVFPPAGSRRQDAQRATPSRFAARVAHRRRRRKRLSTKALRRRLRQCFWFPHKLYVLRRLPEGGVRRVAGTTRRRGIGATARMAARVAAQGAKGLEAMKAFFMGNARASLIRCCLSFIFHPWSLSPGTVRSMVGRGRDEGLVRPLYTIINVCQQKSLFGFASLGACVLPPQWFRWLSVCCRVP